MNILVNTSRCTCTKLKECNTSRDHRAIPIAMQIDDVDKDLEILAKKGMRSIWGDEPESIDDVEKEISHYTKNTIKHLMDREDEYGDEDDEPIVYPPEHPDPLPNRP